MADNKNSKQLAFKRLNRKVRRKKALDAFNTPDQEEVPEENLKTAPAPTELSQATSLKSVESQQQAAEQLAKQRILTSKGINLKERNPENTVQTAEHTNKQQEQSKKLSETDTKSRLRQILSRKRKSARDETSNDQQGGESEESEETGDPGSYEIPQQQPQTEKAPTKKPKSAEEKAKKKLKKRVKIQVLVSSMGCCCSLIPYIVIFLIVIFAFAALDTANPLSN